MRIRGIHARRAMIGAGVLLAALGAAVAPNAFASDTRTLSLYEIHTKERLTVTYKRDGEFDDEALEKLNYFMRDWRTDEPTKMDRELIDLIWTLHTQLGSQEPIHLISGYRSAKTNAKLRRRGGGQARKSQHIQGRAADIHFPDVPVKKLRASALIQEVGGVGYYPTSGIPFVHVDTGRVRMWPRMPRLELAALFPDGKTGYVPRDGRRITKKDHERALAKGMVNKTLLAAANPATPPPTPKPQPIMASFTPPMALAPADKPATPAPQLASANAGGGVLPWLQSRLSPEPKRPAVPTYEKTQVVGPPKVDDDHPDELSYLPFETASLMTDTSVARNPEIAPLSHPEQKDLGYLFEDMDRPTAFKLRRTSGYLGLASVQTFSGRAVKSLYAAIDAQTGPTRLAQR
ncbi:DUF882 domain-containing protein [Methyloceanibacter sp.]|uniref:DUF882 domain-containing protein n=1 Tax=Methyloceanibacter sp. TaxID=1965321 RepID=UPI00356506FA